MGAIILALILMFTLLKKHYSYCKRYIREDAAMGIKSVLAGIIIWANVEGPVVKKSIQLSMKKISKRSNLF